MSSQFIFTGSWRGKGDKSGIRLYYRDTSGKLCLGGDFFEEVTVGQMAVDQNRGILYFTDECAQNKQLPYYGGSLLAARIRQDPPSLELLSRVPTLTSNPAGLCLDKSGEFAIVAHHVARSFVVRLRQEENGTFATEKHYDQVTLCLFRLEADGSVGPMLDMVTVHPEGDRCPHLHSVIASPDFECFAVCDKGLDKVYTFGIDRQRGKLIAKDSARAEPDTQPRYGIFHPTLPLLYTNHENAPLVYVWAVEPVTGALKLRQRLQIPCSEKKVMPSDILLSRNGKKLYVSLRGPDEIAVMSLGAEGELTWETSVSCHGENPRGLALDRESGELYCANYRSGEICLFETGSSGIPEFSGTRLEAPAPGCVAFWNP